MKFYSFLSLFLCVVLSAQGVNLLRESGFGDAGAWNQGLPMNISFQGDVVSLTGDSSERCYLQQTEIPMIAGATYRFSVEYRSDDATRGHFYLERDSYPGSIGGKEITGSSRWQTAEFVFEPTAPKQGDCVYYAVLSALPGAKGVLQYRNPQLTLMEESLSNVKAEAKNILPALVPREGGWHAIDPGFVEFTGEGVVRVTGSAEGREGVLMNAEALQEGVPYAFTVFYRGTPGTQIEYYVERMEPYQIANRRLPVSEDWRMASMDFVLTPGGSARPLAVLSLPKGETGTVEFARPILERRRGVLVNGDFAGGTLGWEGEGWRLTDLGDSHGACARLDSRMAVAGLRQSGLSVEKGKIYRLDYDVQGGEDLEYTDIQHATWFRFAVLDDRGEVIPATAGWRDTRSGDWRGREVTFIADRDMEVTLQGEPRGAGIVYFDNVRFGETLSEVALLDIALKAPFSYHNGARIGDAASEFSGTVHSVIPMGTITVSFRGQEQVFPADAPAEFVFAMPEEIGEYPLKATLRDERGTVLAEEEIPFTLRERASRDIRFDENNVLHIDGKPVFPICSWGNFGVLPLRESFQMHADLGFDVVMCNATQLDDLADFGLFGMPRMSASLGAVAEDGLPAQGAALRAQYAETLQHPSMFGWFVTDEPTWSGLKSSETIRAYRRFLKYVDDEHPCFLNEAPRGTPDGNRGFSFACDIYGIDIYPIPGPSGHSSLDDKMMSCVGKYTDICQETVRHQKPVWMSLQAFSWGTLYNQPIRIFPTLPEARYMVYESIAHGATGVFYWGLNLGPQQNDKYLGVLKKANQEIHSLSAILIAPASKDVELLGAPESQVRVCHKANDAGELWILLNESGEKAEFTLKGDFPANLREVATDARFRPAADGTLSLSLPPYGLLVLTDADRALPAPLVMPATHRVKERVELPTDFRKASRIWYPGEGKKAGSQAVFRIPVKLDKPLEHAWLAASVDNGFVAYVNGKEIMRQAQWDLAFTLDIAKELQVGENEIVLHCADYGPVLGGTFCGALFSLTLSDGRVILSNDKIQVQKPSDRRWVKAEVVAKFGDDPWLNVEAAPYEKPAEVPIP